MSGRGLAYHSAVPGEVREFCRFYSGISPELADRFWNELQDTLERIRRFPQHYHFDACGLRRAQLKSFPVHVLFKILPGMVRITTVRHDRRNPDYGARRR